MNCVDNGLAVDVRRAGLARAFRLCPFRSLVIYVLGKAGTGNKRGRIETPDRLV